ncbi:MAG: response regulator [Campylobacteraceae bacterium]|nr:response regulator [Campylobacteraceae bacterium]
MAIEKKLLKRLKALYVEDDKHIRTELSALLSNFFGKVYTAADGAEGLKTYLENSDDIDVIISDINMPKLTGIEMLKKIREVDPKVPTFFATAYSDNEFLSEAIKLKVYDYIIKPIDIRNLLAVMNDLANVLYQDFLIEQQTVELEKYKDIINTNNIVVKTDTSSTITYVNQHFCDTTGYTQDEVVGQKFEITKHKDTDSSIITELFSTVLDNNAWKGKLKNVTKSGEAYTVDCYAISTINDAGEITGTISVQKDITSEMNQRREVQMSLMKDKGEIFIKGKESSTELNTIIKELNNRVNESQRMLKNSDLSKDKIIYQAEKHTLENKRLKIEIAQYKKDGDTSNKSLKINKKNADLKQEITKLKLENEKLLVRTEKDFIQERVNFEVKIDDLEKELSEYKTKMDEIIDAEVYTQKLNYWREKAKEEAQRAETLERKILQHGDQGILNKLFGGKAR